MYADHFGLRELPFNITPDPRFLYLNDCYQEALAALSYGIEARKGFISLVGDAGTGKTTLLRRVLDTVGPATKTVLLLNPSVGFDEILEHILLELGVPPEGGRKLVLLQRLNEFLLEHTAAGGNVVLLIDEAQDLRPDVLEELRLLSNLETAREKILQIVLAGQPELDDTLANPSLRQLRQRVTLRLRLRPLSPSEVAAYVRTRLEHVGGPTTGLFTPAALARIAALSHGIPRLVNVLCDAALMVAFASSSRTVTIAIVEEAWRDHDTGMPSGLETMRPAPLPPVGEPEPIAADEASDDVSPPPSFEAADPLDPLVSSDLPQTEAPVRKSLSVPVAATAVVAMAVVLYVVSLRQHPVPGAEPRATASASAPSELAPGATAPAPPQAAAALVLSEASASERRPDLPAAVDAPLSNAEAAALVDEFRAAYEARDVDRLVQLFTEDADKNGVRGLEAIAASFRNSLPTLSDVRYSVPTLAVTRQGSRAEVRAPFILTYHNAEGVGGEIRGQAEWSLERRAGRARIVALSYRLEPSS